MVVRLGHNYYDKTPLIGKIVDINIWDRCHHDSPNFNIFSQTFGPRGRDRIHQLPQLCPHTTRCLSIKNLRENK